MKNLNKIIEEINALKAEDYKNYQSEDQEEQPEYERGFNAGVGLCLAILDNEKVNNETAKFEMKNKNKSMLVCLYTSLLFNVLIWAILKCFKLL
jgi:hypothetical protein